jgi:hypothetical protein
MNTLISAFVTLLRGVTFSLLLLELDLHARVIALFLSFYRIFL